LPRSLNGLYVSGNNLYFKDGLKTSFIFNVKEFRASWGEHNLMNLMEAALASYLYGLSWSVIKSAVKDLPQISLRQEIVYKKNNLTIINDGAGTSPDATVAALKRFSRPKTNLILLTGGTDKNLDYRELAKIIKRKILPNNLILLNGSGTKKLIDLLYRLKYSSSYLVLESLEDCLKGTFPRLRKESNVILFSPAGSSFEKFKNEFDRGAKFNETVKKLLR